MEKWLLKDNKRMFQEIIEAISMVMNLSERHKLYHGHQVARLSTLLGKEYGLAGRSLKNLVYGALLHDLGEIGTVDDLMNKQGDLENQEFLRIWDHPQKGAQIIKKIRGLEEVSNLVRWHHEWWDGTGYPDQLQAEQIPLEAQIIRLSDSIVSMLSDRPYRKALPLEQVVELVKKDSGKQFNPQLVDCFLTIYKQGRVKIDYDQNEWSNMFYEIIGPEEEFANKYLVSDLLNLFSTIIDAKNPYTAQHSLRVSLYAAKLAQALDLSSREVELCRIAGLLHDAGKVGVDGEILNKPDKLSDEEFQVIKAHPEMSYQIINSISGLEEVALYSRYHHERFDGRGYPVGLTGEDIPLISRIIAVADTYDAMTSNRPYRQGVSHEVAIEEIKQCRGTQLDPQVALRFCLLKD